MNGIKSIYSIALGTIIFMGLGTNAIAANFAKVMGTLSYPHLSAAQMQAATAYITLVDVSPRQDSSGSIIARVAIANLERSPIYFELKYNPAQIDPKHLYAVQARITNQGKVILTNTSPYPVITRGNPHIDIVLTTNKLPR